MDNAVALAACTATVRGMASMIGCTRFGRSVTGINIPQKKLMGTTTSDVTTIKWYGLSSTIEIATASEEKNAAVAMIRNTIRETEPKGIPKK